MTESNEEIAIVLAGIVWDPAEYDRVRENVWAQMMAALEERGKQVPFKYPGSVRIPCAFCNVGVCIGPKQQEKMQDAQAVILCMICAFQRQVAMGGDHPTWESVDLGNTWMPKQKKRH